MRLPRSDEKFAGIYVGEIRKVQRTGPYHIIGFSVGGTIAYEIARQLQESGEAVALLGLIETDTGRYRKIARKAGAAVLRRSTIFQTVKQVYGTARQTVKRIKEKRPNE